MAMLLAAHVFSFGDPGASGRLLGEWFVWSIGLTVLVAWVPPRSLRLQPLGHAVLVLSCLAMAMLGGFFNATSYFQTIGVTKDGDLTIQYEGARDRQEWLASRQVDAVEVAVIRTLGTSPMCRLIVVSQGWQHRSQEDDCRIVERARDAVLLTAGPRDALTRRQSPSRD